MISRSRVIWLASLSLVVLCTLACSGDDESEPAEPGSVTCPAIGCSSPLQILTFERDEQKEGQYFPYVLEIESPEGVTVCEFLTDGEHVGGHCKGALNGSVLPWVIGLRGTPETITTRLLIAGSDDAIEQHFSPVYEIEDGSIQEGCPLDCPRALVFLDVEAPSDCPSLSDEDCIASWDCYLLRATKLTEVDGEWCGTETIRTECRIFGIDCGDADGVSYWCDTDNGVWRTSLACGPTESGPAGTESCLAEWLNSDNYCH